MTPRAKPIPVYPSFTGLSAFEWTSSEFWYLAGAMFAGGAIAHVAGQNEILGAGIGALALLVFPRSLGS
jgi:hypothetical protein